MFVCFCNVFGATYAQIAEKREFGGGGCLLFITSAPAGRELLMVQELPGCTRVLLGDCLISLFATRFPADLTY